MRTRRLIMFIWLIAAVLLLQACGPGQNQQSGLPAAFDLENQQEFGIRGMYLGQNIKQVIEILKPEKADFMDAVTRESFTVDQLAAGAGTTVMGLLFVDDCQLMITVKQGVLHSIAVGGVPKEKATLFATNRGLAVYDSKERLQELYGPIGEEKEGQITLQGKKYQVVFSLNDNQVIGYRFVTIE
ncbi:hypothetical protein NDK47_09735 [Brevibacillus ruminantium]|uniref:DUF4309 domain-containing protein n=1 Tax=Brevibacillus ruminantium TaxID=2950604 RepID=A0ABY4WK83_9BACL|nr:hypothetical protein [Brevibacillus ruminantium]USG67527.1 hypothetical protein NDK47_09735 [Brevibacillus ruminantium]